MRRRRGFTLLECIIATFVMAAGFLAVASMYPASQGRATMSKNRIQGIRLARNVLESLRSHPWGTSLKTLIIAANPPVVWNNPTTTTSPDIPWTELNEADDTPGVAAQSAPVLVTFHVCPLPWPATAPDSRDAATISGFDSGAALGLASSGTDVAWVVVWWREAITGVLTMGSGWQPNPQTVAGGRSRFQRVMMTGGLTREP